MSNVSPGANFSYYRIVSKLGAGRMGEVYLAEDTKPDRKVALKLRTDARFKAPLKQMNLPE